MHIGDVINIFWFLCDKTCCCASVQSSNHVVQIHVTSVSHSPYSSCANVFVLTTFCDVLLNTCTATWNLFVHDFNNHFYYH